METDTRRPRRINFFRRAGWLAVAAMVATGLFAAPGVALGHTATKSCEVIHITQTPTNEPAFIYSEPTHTLVAGPVGDGDYTVPAGDYQVRWPAWGQTQDNQTPDTHFTNLTVGACDTGHKVWVCKYVGTPGVDEQLKDGKNPITVDSNATVGAWFNDGQGRSFVLDTQTDQNTGDGNTYIGPLSCPVPTPPPTGPTTTCDPGVGGSVGWTGVPDGWKLIIEPGDHLYTSSFTSISLPAGGYTYQFRDANNKDTVGGKFSIVACAPATATVTFQKTVDNTGGGIATPDMFTLWYGPLPKPDNLIQLGNGKSVDLTPGNYWVQEGPSVGPLPDILARYTQTSLVCVNGETTRTASGSQFFFPVFSVASGDAWTCTINDKFVPIVGPTTTCASSGGTGTVGFTGVPPTWKLTISPGNIVVTNSFTGISLAKGDYTYQFKDGIGDDQGSGSFSIVACTVPPPPPTPVVSTACGGSVTFTNLLAGWTYRIDSTTGTAIAVTTTSVGPLAEGVGLHTYQFMDAPGAVVASGSFTIDVCRSIFQTQTPTPSPTATTEAATGTPAPPPTGEVAGATGKPHVTPPPTSALGSIPAQPAGDTWRIAPLGLAALLASLLVFSPKTSPERRRR